MSKYILFIGILIVACLTGYGLVFGNSFVSDTNIKYLGALSKNIYLDTPHLSKTIVVYNSNIDLKRYEVVSLCNTQSKFLTQYKTAYLFEVDYALARDCKNPNIILSSGEHKIIDTLSTLKLHRNSDNFEKFLDYPDEHLQMLQERYSKWKRSYSVYRNYNGKDVVSNYKYLHGQRKFFEAEYQLSKIEQILTAREQAYASPVPGYTLDSTPSKLPNAARPYRAAYTDGIHHGWDISAPRGAATGALDDGIIVRVVRGFTDRRFDDIVYGDDLSEDQKHKNLDILRGNQVWLKTMKGDVVFYSHLGDIPQNIYEGKRVSRGENLGSIDITGVPGAAYAHYHLHFAIMENPHIIEKAGNYDFGDYMTWDWLLKGESYETILVKQKEIFSE